MGDDNPIFSQQRHHIRHRGQRRQLQQRLRRLPPEQRPDQLPRHARAAQAAERIGAQQRIDHGGRVGQSVGRFVVVGDNQGHAAFGGGLGRGKRIDAAVHADQQGVPRRQALHRLHVEAVAFPVARGRVHVRMGAVAAQGLDQQRRSAHAVHVVVPIDHHRAVLRHRLPHGQHRLRHAVHAQRVVQIVQRGMQKGLRLRLRAHAARPEQARQGERQPRLQQRIGPDILQPPNQPQQARTPFFASFSIIMKPRALPCGKALGIGRSGHIFQQGNIARTHTVLAHPMLHGSTQRHTHLPTSLGIILKDILYTRLLQASRFDAEN